MFHTMEGAIADDFSNIVNAGRRLEYPTRTSRNETIEILRPALLVNHGVVHQRTAGISNVCVSDDDIRVIDRQTGTVDVQRAQIRHRAVDVEEGMGLKIPSCVGLPCDPAARINGEGLAPGAAERAKVRHDAVTVSE